MVSADTSDRSDSAADVVVAADSSPGVSVQAQPVVSRNVVSAVSVESNGAQHLVSGADASADLADAESNEPASSPVTTAPLSPPLFGLSAAQATEQQLNDCYTFNVKLTLVTLDIILNRFQILLNKDSVLFSE